MDFPMSQSPVHEFLQGLAPEDFNLAQMLQGENVPASVFQLQVGWGYGGPWGIPLASG